MKFIVLSFIFLLGIQEKDVNKDSEDEEYDEESLEKVLDTGGKEINEEKIDQKNIKSKKKVKEEKK